MNYKQIVWLASYPKSGNTWLRALFEAYYTGGVDINSIVTSVPDDIASRHSLGMAGGMPGDIKRMPVDIQQLARPSALLRLCLTHRQNLENIRVSLGRDFNIPLLLKTHSINANANGIELIPEQLTKATICLIRDPRDVVLSFSKHLGLSIDDTIERMKDPYMVLSAKETESKLDDTVSSWRQFYRSYYGTPSARINSIVFKYEDLRADTAGVFTEMLMHIGETPDPMKVLKAVSLCKLANLRKQEKEQGFVEASKKNKDGFFGKGAVGGWRDKLTPSQQNRIMKHAGSLMKRYGYK